MANKFNKFIDTFPTRAESFFEKSKVNQWLDDTWKTSAPYQTLSDIGEKSGLKKGANAIIAAMNAITVAHMNNTDPVFNFLMTASPEELCDFNLKNQMFRYRLMKMNLDNRELTLSHIGGSVSNNGDSQDISHEVMAPSYTTGNNYVEDYARTITSNQARGIESNRSVSIGADYKNPYQVTINQYPDQDGTGTFDNKWNLSGNKNSLLYKTKNLFLLKKINTIVDRFHTDPQGPDHPLNTKTEFGMSHGNNVLTRNAEYSGKSYPKNGYDNPYCRVWTHHHQYDEYTKVIRPFVNEEGQPVTLKQFHEWGRDWEYDNENKVYKGYYKSKDNKGWNYSVIGNNGLPNITPKYISGGNSNIHTKQCMFSIENLAWRDYDPYSFETALSWEQRGPMGGRIMWFPPYGIQFNETTNTQWNANQFIGRGEDVYTYTNTTRSGSLRFMLVVDHPSIVDYVGWNEANHDVVRTTDWRRFFAGCDTVDPDDDGGYGGGGSTVPNGSGGKNYGPGFSIVSKAKPTPLTDEYIQYSDEKDIKDILKNPPSEEKQVDEPKTVTFYVFYPNNYSGAYDRMKDDSINKKGTGTNTNVDAIAYLLYGKGAQMNENGTQNRPIKFSDDNNDENCGTGYEMSNKSGLGKNTNNYIKHSKFFWTSYTEENYKTNNVEYDDIKYYYRIDYDYQNEYIVNSTLKSSPNGFVNTFDQVLNKNSYVDTQSFGLNFDVNKVAEIFDEQDKLDIESNKGEYLASLAEIAYLLCNNQKNKERISQNYNGTNTISFEEDERLKRIKEILIDEPYEITGVKITGYSNIHGFNANDKINKKRNDELAKNRYKTVHDWLSAVKGEWKLEENYEGSVPVDKDDKFDESGLSAKKWRSAKVVINFKDTSQNNLTESNQSPKITDFKMTDVVNEIVEKFNFCECKGQTNFQASKEFVELRDTSDKSIGKLEYYNMIEDVCNNLSLPIEHLKYTIAERLKTYVDVKIDNNVNLYNLDSEANNDEYCTIDYKLYNVYDYINLDSDEVKEFEDKVNREYLNIKYETVNYDKLIDGLNKVFESLPANTKEFNYKEDDFDKNKGNILKNISNTSLKLIENAINDYFANTDLNIPDEQIKKMKEQMKANAKTILSNNYENLFCNASVDNVGDLSKYGCTFVAIYDPQKFEYSIELTDHVMKNIVDESFIDKINENITKKQKTENRFSVDDLISLVKNDVNYNLSKIVGDKYKVNEPINKKDLIYSDNVTCFDEAYERIWRVHETDGEKSQLLTHIEDLGLPNDTKLYQEIITFVKGYYDDVYKQGLTVYLTLCRLNNLFINYEKEEYSNLTYEGKTDINFEKEILETLESYDNSEYIDFSKHVDPKTKEVYYINENENDPAKRARQWVEVRDPKTNAVTKIVLKDPTIQRYDVTNQDPNIGKDFENTYNRASKNYYRYDQEYHFFKVLEQKSKFTYDKLMDKIKYFDPAFHSMTPEGFNARLTFLNQCMRQGNTVAATDLNNPNRSASNLAFGRPPYCVLRLGDFYNQLIVIDNISIDYDPLQWDLNTEGIGMQPLLANVNISFKFIGGGDMAGPVRRLQNAMSFNYYANASLYDNRADRMSYNFDEKTNGALDHNMIMKDTYFHNVENYKERN